jgi:protein SCO1/2
MYRTKAAELLLAAFATQPDHPGIDHYLTYCLGHAGYQPKPFERIPMIAPVHRMFLAAIAVLALLGGTVFVLHSPAVGPSVPGGPFALTAPDGRSMTDRSLQGRWSLVYFGYTNCPNVCPMTLGAIATILQELGPLADEIQPIFITLDPERDTPQRIDEFTKAFDARIIGLGGPPAEIAAAAHAYHVFFRKVPGDAPDSYFIEHSSYIFLMDPQGRYVTLFTSDQAEAPDELAQRIRQLLMPATSRG